MSSFAPKEVIRLRLFNGQSFAQQLGRVLIPVDDTTLQKLGSGLHALQETGLEDRDPRKIDFVLVDELGVWTYVTTRLDEDGLVLLSEAVQMVERSGERKLSELTRILIGMEELRWDKLTDELVGQLTERNEVLSGQLALVGIVLQPQER